MSVSIPVRLLLLPVLLLLAACTPTASAPSAPPPTPQVEQTVSNTPNPTSTSAPLPTPAPTAPPLPTATPMDDMARLAAAERMPHNRVMLARALAGQSDLPAVTRTTPLDVQVGHVKEFWVTSFVNNSTYPVSAELRYAGPVVLMYVEQGIAIDQAALESAAQVFETRIYPRTRQLFGSEWQPGVDGDPRIVVLNVGSIDGGVLGYFSPRDSVPAAANRFSNEHEMFYMNVGTMQPGSNAYIDTLAHEFQHMIHWNEQRSAATWFNEGNATLSQDLNGFVNQHFVSSYLFDPDTQLTTWQDEPLASIAHYGAAHLFLRYIYAHYAGESGLQELIRADASNHLPAFAEFAAHTRPDIADFGDLFADWAVANLLDNPAIADGRYSYTTEKTNLTLLPNTVTPTSISTGSTADTVNQFGIDYLALPADSSSVSFDGSTSANLTATMPRDGTAWWSGRGDNSAATLTHAFDLRGLAAATLEFETWYELEQGYDYAFVTVSVDGGTTWQTLSGTHTTTDDPHGANYGNGLTGVSGTASSDERGQWVTERTDLTPYTGQEVQIRFWQINDEGFHAPGILIDNVRIPELGFSDDVESGIGEWEAEGFVQVDGDLPQQWELRLVRTAADGSIQVEVLPVDAQAQASASLSADESAVLVVMATTPHTTEPASYTVTVK